MQKRLPLSSGTVLQGRYRITRQLGHGGMGAVYEAENIRVSALVALKETFADDDYTRGAFEREAKMLANMTHEAFPRVMDYFAEGDGCYLVMELIRGKDLADYLEERSEPFETGHVLEWTDQILDALEDLHSQNIVHRDIKPSNLKLTPRGRIKLLDFGIAKGAAGDMTAAQTTTGSMAAATLQYAPLEQVLRADPNYYAILSVHYANRVEDILRRGTDARSDLYALGATVYQLLTKQAPANAPTRALAIWSGQGDKLRPAHEINPQVPVHISYMLHQAMQLERENRLSSATEMRRMLRGQKEEETVIRGAVLPSPAAAPTEMLPSPRMTEAKTEVLKPMDTGNRIQVNLNAPQTGAAPKVPTNQNFKSAPTAVSQNNSTWWWIGGALPIGLIFLIILGGVIKNLMPLQAPTTANTLPSNVVSRNSNAAVVVNANSGRLTSNTTNTTNTSGIGSGSGTGLSNTTASNSDSTEPAISPEARNYMKEGRAFLDEKKFDKAVESYSKVIALEPNYDKAYLGRGSAYGFLKNYDRAIADLTKVIELNPSLASAYNNRGVAYKQSGNYDRAIADYNKAIELSPNDAMYYQNRANAYREKGDTARAEADRKRALALGGK